MSSIKSFDDDQVILMAWEVVERNGWAFAIDTLLRGGIELFPPDSSSAEEKGFWDGVGHGTQVGLFSPPSVSTDCSTVMASQESDDEEDTSPMWDIFNLSSSDLRGQKRTFPSWDGQGQNTSLHTPSSSHDQSPVQTDDKLNLSLDSKIQQFVTETTTSFKKYFSNIDLLAAAPQSEESRNDQSDHSSSVTLADSVPEVVSKNAPPEELPVSKVSHTVPLQAKPPVQQVAMVPAMPASQSEAVAKHETQLSGNMTSWLPSLASHVNKELQAIAVSLRYFNMFGLLRGRSHEIFLSQTELSTSQGNTIYNWQKGFAIMGSILFERAPHNLKGFFCYGETICSVYKNSKGQGWLMYDEKFRRLKAENSGLSWDTLLTEMWEQLCDQPVTVLSSITCTPTKEKDASSAYSTDRLSGSCGLYNQDLCNMGSSCPFNHVCSHCLGEHPKMYCQKLYLVSSTPPLKRIK